MTTNSELLARARARIPGGVNSPVRAFNGVGGEPIFFHKAKGSRLYDINDRAYIDYVGSWGPMIAGHAHPDIVRAVQNAAENGLSFGTPTPSEVTMAERLCELVDGMDMVRMVNSGTEATMSAIRVARAATGRDRIIKFEGCYHGHADTFLVKAGSGALTLGIPNSPGVPAATADLTMTLPFNDAEAVRQALELDGEQIAAIIVEPVAGNMNCIPPVGGYLDALRRLCDQHGCVLIFDEVMTGFRVALGGAQALYGVTPDLSTFGKVIGGGMPVGAFGGKKELMELVAPIGLVYQAGTLSGNPVAMAAGLANLDLITAPGFYQELGNKTGQLVSGIRKASIDAGVPMAFSQVGGMFGMFFTSLPEVTSFAEVMKCDVEAFKRFFHLMLDAGVYLAPSAFEAGFVSSAHSDQDIQDTISAARSSLQKMV